MSDEHVQHIDTLRERGGGDGQVPCPRCQRLIAAHSRQCMYCGVHFRGYAYEFSPEEQAAPNGTGRYWRILLLLVLVLVVLVMATFGVAALLGRISRDGAAA